MRVRKQVRRAGQRCLHDMTITPLMSFFIYSDKLASLTIFSISGGSCSATVGRFVSCSTSCCAWVMNSNGPCFASKFPTTKPVSLVKENFNHPSCHFATLVFTLRSLKWITPSDWYFHISRHFHSISSFLLDSQTVSWPNCISPVPKSE